MHKKIIDVIMAIYAGLMIAALVIWLWIDTNVGENMMLVTAVVVLATMAISKEFRGRF